MLLTTGPCNEFFILFMHLIVPFTPLLLNGLVDNDYVNKFIMSSCVHVSVHVCVNVCVHLCVCLSVCVSVFFGYANQTDLPS